MAEESKRSEIWAIITRMQQSEATLHWQRNSYFSVVASILILAVSQFDTPIFQVIIGFLGIGLSVIWILIQDRSSRYIDYWKAESRKFDTQLGTSIYPKSLGGVEMRKLAYLLPLVFLAIWAVIIVTSALTIGQVPPIEKGTLSSETG